MSLKLNKNIIISIIIILIGIGIALFIIKIHTPKASSYILEKENFDVEEKTIENPINNETTKYTKYIKDNITLNKYYYSDLESIKNEVKIEYNQYKDNIGFETDIKENEKYIYLVACSSDLCFYTLGYENEIVQTITETINKDKTSEIYNELIEGMKLK